ncbi:outer membrane lipoprotein carrier protein LolA [Natrarchaeobius sp. A-rgal3]|uniref:LolA family protein n=1 Tax=Natrarchaeobius versutus TaxID=1679078 RepID=UPI00350EEB63
MALTNGPLIGMLAAVLAVVAFGVGGAVVVEHLDDDPDADELVADVVDDHGGIETLQATERSEHELHHVGDDDPTVVAMDAQVELRPPDQRRTEIRSKSGSADVPDVTVVNGSTRTHYVADDDQVMVDDDSDWEAIQYSPETFLESIETEYVGTDTVDGREAHVVEIHAAENASGDGGLGVLVGDTEYVLGSADETDATNVTKTMTWWIDVEATYPIKEQIVTEYDEPRQHALERERTVRTVTYENVRFDEPIPDDRFAFEPPPETDVVEPVDSVDVSTFDDADGAVPFPVSEPTLPDSFELVIVTASEFEGDATVQFLYRNGESLEDDEIMGRITERPPAYGSEDVETEGVGDVDGAFVSTPMGTTLVWHCGDVRYELTPDVDGNDEAFALDVADSMGCPA